MRANYGVRLRSAVISYGTSGVITPHGLRCMVRIANHTGFGGLRWKPAERLKPKEKCVLPMQQSLQRWAVEVQLLMDARDKCTREQRRIIVEKHDRPRPSNLLSELRVFAASNPQILHNTSRPWSVMGHRPG